MSGVPGDPIFSSGGGAKSIVGGDELVMMDMAEVTEQQALTADVYNPAREHARARVDVAGVPWRCHHLLGCPGDGATSAIGGWATGVDVE